MKYWLCMFAIIVLTSACIHKPATSVQPVTIDSNMCDTINVTYKNDIQPILNSNCYSCHGTAVVANDGLDLQDSASLKNYLKYDFRGDGIYGSKLYHCMLHSVNAQSMPPNYIVDSCALAKMKHWLSLGGPM